MQARRGRRGANAGTPESVGSIRKNLHSQTLHRLSAAVSSVAFMDVPEPVGGLLEAHIAAMASTEETRFEQDEFYRFAVNVAMDLAQAVGLLGATLQHCVTVLTPVRPRISCCVTLVMHDCQRKESPPPQ